MTYTIIMLSHILIVDLKLNFFTTVSSLALMSRIKAVLKTQHPPQYK